MDIEQLRGLQQAQQMQAQQMQARKVVQQIQAKQNDAHEIIPRLWLGNKRAALSPEWLQGHKIGVVMNCSKDIPFAPDTAYTNRRIYRIAIDDSLRDPDIDFLTQSSEEVAYTLLREYQTGANILVHCAAGMQRSAASVTMLLMTLNRWPAEYTMSYIKNIRPIAFTPGVNFRRSIDHYERKLFSEIIPTVDHLKRE